MSTARRAPTDFQGVAPPGELSPRSANSLTIAFADKGFPHAIRTSSTAASKLSFTQIIQLVFCSTDLERTIPNHNGILINILVVDEFFPEILECRKRSPGVRSWRKCPPCPKRLSRN